MEDAISRLKWREKSVGRLGHNRVDIFHRVPDPSIWMYYLPDPDTNRVVVPATMESGQYFATFFRVMEN